MISPSAAWQRLQRIAMFKGTELKDFRPISYGALYSIAGASSAGPVRQDFPGGAIILGVSAASVGFDGGNADAFDAAATGSRSSFALAFSYTNDEQLTPGGPHIAEALLGGGDQTIYPPREIVVAPSQGINVTVQNLTSTQIKISLVWHCLVWRFAS